jgi:arylsulfatase A-like enzyme
MSIKNVLFITADQWRGDCLSSMNHPVVKTPHLDAIAAEGMQFTKHYTNAVPCGPSRASLHTGLYLHNHRSGTNGTPLDDRFTNWALELRSRGYDPVLFGYTHTSPDPRNIPLDDPRLKNDEGILPGMRPIVDMGTLCPDWRKFLQKKGYDLPAVDGAIYALRDTASLASSTISTDSNDEVRNRQTPNPLAIDKTHTDTHYLTDRVIDYIDTFRQDSLNAKNGWCVHLSLRAPHPPWVAPKPYNSLYPLEDLPLPIRQESTESEGEAHPWLREHLATPRVQSHEDLTKHRQLQASYYGLMSEVDDNMGRLVEQLKSIDEWENTLFIFTSDHGEQMGDHWMYGKAGFFDQSFHIPLIICSPTTKPGRCEKFTEHVDIFPTIMETLGVPTPRQCDGYSLVPQLVTSQLEGWRDAVNFEYDFRHTPSEGELALDMEEACLNVVRDDNYKYVHFANLPELLFDLMADPQELNNIAPENPELVAQYAKKLLSWRMKSTDRTLTHLQVSREQGLVDKSLR